MSEAIREMTRGREVVSSCFGIFSVINIWYTRKNWKSPRQQDVFKLDVAVYDALAVEVAQPCQDLSEEEPGDLLLQLEAPWLPIMSQRLPPG